MSYSYRQNLNWLVSDFTVRVAGVMHAIAASADGVPLGVSEYIPEGFAGQFAAITCGLYSLIQGAARIFEAGQPGQALVDMGTGLMIVMAIGDGASLAVLASLDCDTYIVSFEIAQLVDAVGPYLAPPLL